MRTPKRKSKYNAKKAEYNGITFDSTKEAKRYVFLKEKEEAGEITNLHRQVTYELLPAVKEIQCIRLKTKEKSVIRTLQRPITYRADFVYCRNGVVVTEDVKASPKMIPAEFKLKEKLFFFKYRYHITKIFNHNEE